MKIKAVLIITGGTREEVDKVIAAAERVADKIKSSTGRGPHIQEFS